MYNRTVGKHKVAFRILLNSILGLVLIFVWSRFVNLPELLNSLKNVKLTYLAGFFVLFFISGSLRGFRFKLLLKKFPLPFKDSIMLVFLSQFLSFMIPLRLGELSKSVYLTAEFGVSLASTITWVFLDRFLDFWVILFSTVVLLVITQSRFSAKLIILMAIILVLFTFAGLLALKSEKAAKKLVKILSRYLILSSIKTRFVIFCEGIIDGFVILRRPSGEFLLLILISFITICVDSLNWILIFSSLGRQILFKQAVLGNSLTAFTFLIPAAPGYVGSAEASILAVFSGVLNLPANLVSAAAVIFHILTIITLPVFGVVSIYLLKFDLGTVWKKLRQK